MTADLCPHGDIDIYAVGFLKDLSVFVHHPDRAQARLRARGALRLLTRRIRRHEWRAVKNYFNGYLAEPTPCDVSRCGTGWTRGRALRDLHRIRSRERR